MNYGASRSTAMAGTSRLTFACRKGSASMGAIRPWWWSGRAAASRSRLDYYATPRGHNDNRSNRRLLTSDALLLGFDAFHLVGELLVQPLQVIVGGKLGTTFSHEAGLSLWERARNRRDFVVIEGADHYDMYDKQEYVDQAIEHLTALYDEHLR